MIEWGEIILTLEAEKLKRAGVVLAQARTGDASHAAGVYDGLEIAAVIVRDLEKKNKEQ